MLAPVHRLLVKIDPSYYERTHGEVTLYLLKEGTEFQRMPKHGELTHNIEGSNIPTGSTVYFIHYAVQNRFRYEGDWYVPVEPKEVIAYEKDGEIIGHSHIVSKRVQSKEWIKNEQAIIKMPFIEEYEDMCAEVTHNPTKLNIDKGDRVWFIQNRDYFIEHLKDYSFLEPEFVVYNETKDEMADGWSMGKNTQSEDKEYVQVNGIYIQKQFTHHKSEVDIVRDTKDFKKGDKILTKYTKANYIPVLKDCVIFKDDKVMLCLN